MVLKTPAGAAVEDAQRNRKHGGKLLEKRAITKDQILFFKTMAQICRQQTLSQGCRMRLAECRDPLFAKFFESQFSPALRERRRVLPRLRHWFCWPGNTMSAVTDTFLLRQLAIDTKDSSVEMEVVKQKLRAFNKVQTALTRCDASRNDDLLGAIDALGILEMSSGTATSDDAWRHHARALLAIFSTRGPDGLVSSFSREIFNDTLPLLLLNSILSRQSCELASPRWRDNVHGIAESRISRILLIAFEIPGLLERTDALAAQSSPSAQGIKDLIHDIVDLSRRLQAQLLIWNASQNCGKAWTEVSVRDFPEFVDQHSATIIRTFPVVYEFSSLLGASVHVLVWLFLSCVHRAIFDVMVIYERIMPDPEMRKKDDFGGDFRLTTLDEDVIMWADRVCRCIPYLTSPANNIDTAAGRHLVGGSLACLSELYQKSQAWTNRLKWCQAVTAQVNRTLLESTPSGAMCSFIVLPRQFVAWMTVCM